MINRYFTVAAVAMLGLAACSPRTDSGGTESSASVSGADAPSNTRLPQVTGFGQIEVNTGKDNLLDCNTPVDKNSTYKSLVARFKNDAQLGNIPGAEGTVAKGVILFDRLKSRHLDITFWDDAMEHVSIVSPGEGAVAWTGPQGVHVGSSLKYIEGVNGKPFTITGFGWDYGGYVADFKGGRLDHLTGGCKLMLRFDRADAEMPEGISGDGVTVSSDDPRVQKFAPLVTEMSVGWALPFGVKPSGG
jgi:hypothetical protein